MRHRRPATALIDHNQPTHRRPARRNNETAKKSTGKNSSSTIGGVALISAIMYVDAPLCSHACPAPRPMSPTVGDLMHGAVSEGEPSSHEAPASGRMAKEEMQGKTDGKFRTCGRARRNTLVSVRRSLVPPVGFRMSCHSVFPWRRAVERLSTSGDERFPKGPIPKPRPGMAW
jgi:hypothetical protein